MILHYKDFNFYHRCENMQLINIYFENDLMIFIRVDLYLVKLVKKV